MTSSSQQTERLYQEYDINKMTSYEQIKHIDAQYGERVISIDEHRNAMGYLLGFDIVLKGSLGVSERSLRIMADLIIAPTMVPVVGEGPIVVTLRVTKINSTLSAKRIVLELGGVEISLPLVEVDNLLASLIEERNKGLSL